MYRYTQQYQIKCVTGQKHLYVDWSHLIEDSESGDDKDGVDTIYNQL